MQIKRRAITVGTTFFLAAATGHVMQNGDTISARLRGEAAPQPPVIASVASTAGTLPSQRQTPPAQTAEIIPANIVVPEPVMSLPEEAPAIAPVVTVSGLPDLPAIAPAPLGSGEDLAERVAALETEAPATASDADKSYTVFGIACTDPVMTLEPTARAMLKMRLSAPCFANERVTIGHEGLSFAMATDVAGDLEVMIPALAENASVTVRFSSGDQVAMTHAVSGLDVLNRVAVGWRGADAMQLNAFENGAGFGDEGHVSPLAPRTRATEAGGFLVTLGDPGVEQPLMAEVYTAPITTAVDDLVVEAAVTEDSCGQTLTGNTIVKEGTAPATGGTLSFAMPGCDAIGDSLMLSLGTMPFGPVSVAANGQ